jgi:hypothetical protein
MKTLDLKLIKIYNYLWIHLKWHKWATCQPPWALAGISRLMLTHIEVIHQMTKILLLIKLCYLWFTTDQGKKPSQFLLLRSTQITHLCCWYFSLQNASSWCKRISSKGNQNCAFSPAFWNMLLTKTSHSSHDTLPIPSEYNCKDDLNFQSNCST